MVKPKRNVKVIEELERVLGEKIGEIEFYGNEIDVPVDLVNDNVERILQRYGYGVTNITKGYVTYRKIGGRRL